MNIKHPPLDFEYEKLLKKINGALKCMIDAHGDITKENYGSASKRIAKLLLSK